MAEQVQSILERMVPPLKDLRNRGLFSPDEIRSIVERRRRSEYLLQRRSAARKSDYLRYIEEEILLEKLRKLRKEKVLTDRRNERMSRHADGDFSDDSDGDDEANKRKHAYQTSGPGDSHILSHIHFLYQRTLKKFHYPLDILLNYANFSKEHKSFHMLGRIYAEGLQHHPREDGLWIEAASFEYFGYVAQDYENGNEANAKVVGSSIRNARVLMQRGLRINKTSKELWLQHFALELHYVQKLRGRREILELGDGSNDSEDDEDTAQDEKETSSLLPCQIIFKNAIKAIPNDIQFRLRFVEACGMFPQTKQLEGHIMESVTRDFGESVEGWVARISYAEEGMQNGEKRNMGFLSKAIDDADEHSDSSDEEKSEGRPAKKARIESESGISEDPALELLHEALEAVPTPKMYLECSRFLQLRIQRLLDEGQSSDEDKDEGLSHLIGTDEDAKVAAKRHSGLLEELYQNAKEKNISSTNLTLDQVEYLCNEGQYQKAEELLSNAADSSAAGGNNDARLWLRWAELSQQMMEDAEASSISDMAPPSSSPIRILRRALKCTPIHERQSYTLILTDLMRHLMAQSSSSLKTKNELHALFQKLILISQGSRYSIPNVNKRRLLANNDGDEDSDEGVGDDKVNLAVTFVAYLKYTMLHDDKDAIQSIYTSVLYHSNYGKSCTGKTEEELISMKDFFDTCLQFELANRTNHSSAATVSSSGDSRKKKKEKKKARKMRLCQMYEVAIGFFESGGGFWRKVVDEYQKGLDGVKYSFQ